MSSAKRYLVTGVKGQLVQSLVERAIGQTAIEIVTLGRPELDLARPEKIGGAVAAAGPDLIISAAAYTAVDRAESDEAAAFAVNADGPAALAEAAAQLHIPIIQISTDYVFDGSKTAPYVETDPVAPLGVYGLSKLRGEEAVAAANPNHAILRTAWVYSPFASNFLKTMLNVAKSRDDLNVVDDQIGNPTSAFDIADAVFSIAQNLLRSPDPSLRGIFHLTAQGEATWADFATEIFRLAAEQGGQSARVARIPSSAYPTPARRPMNSRLDCSKLRTNHKVSLPDWRLSTADVVTRLIKTDSAFGAS
jgi:dTDP-4-dehydrorhamnose reductase